MENNDPNYIPLIMGVGENREMPTTKESMPHPIVGFLAFWL